VTARADRPKRRTPLIGRVVFAGLVLATLAAFFISQHLKVTTPFIAGLPHPEPAAINPLTAKCRSTTVSFFLLHHVDNVDVYVVNQSGTTVRSLVRGLFMRKKETRSFTWNGRDSSGRPVTPGTYFFRVYLIHQERTIEIQQPVRVVTSTTCH
jgi:flagellar hook assembly protein FlgD